MVFSSLLRRSLRRVIVSLHRDRRGIALMETVVAVTVFSALGLAFMTGLRVAFKSGAVVEKHSVAERLARNQMEYVLTQPYEAPVASYTSISAASDVSFTVERGYAVTAVAEPFTGGDATIVDDNKIETVKVTVTRDGVTVLELETLRADD